MPTIPTYFRRDDWVKSVQGTAVSGAQVYCLLQPANVVGTTSPTPLANIFLIRVVCFLLLNLLLQTVLVIRIFMCYRERIQLLCLMQGSYNKYIQINP